MNPTESDREDELLIDGSFGEGGGQIIRSALALSIITNRPIHLINIRANRKKPGLMKQHLTSVNAGVEISAAEVKGNHLHSTEVRFHPKGIRPGDYVFNIGTAGSTGLVLQTVLPVLMFAEKPSSVRVTGGTHNNKSPCYDFLASAYAPLINKIGPKLDFNLIKHGFYPKGGGEVRVEISPVIEFHNFHLVERGALKSKSLHSLAANLPEDIAKREIQQFKRKSKWSDLNEKIDLVKDSLGPGNAMFIKLQFKQVTELFTSFGAREVSAAQVANQLWREVKPFVESEAAIGEHLADQIMLPLAISAFKSGTQGVFSTTDLSLHSRTHLDIISRFLPIVSTVTETGDNLYQVEICRKD